jgi:hypothetical protein
MQMGKLFLLRIPRLNELLQEKMEKQSLRVTFHLDSIMSKS